MMPGSIPAAMGFIPQDSIASEMKLQNGGLLPIFIVTDTFNRIVFCSEGYTIGLGEQMQRVIKGL